MFDSIKEAFSVIEEHYSVKIPTSEVAYIYDILINIEEKIGKDEEFWSKQDTATIFGMYLALFKLRVRKRC